MENSIDKYEQQANDFLEKTGTSFKVKFLYSGPYFEDDKDYRDIYSITLRRKDKVYNFKFGQSIAKSKSGIKRRRIELDNKGKWISAMRLKHQAPTAYDVLACVTKYDPGTFANFCDEYGFDTDSRKAEKTYFAVQDEWVNINKLFSDVMDELSEIQ